MKNTHILACSTAVLLLLGTSAPAFAQGDLGDLQKAAAELQKAAGDLEDAAAELQKLETLGTDVKGVEAPAGTKSKYECSKYQRIVVNYKKGENKVLGDRKEPLLIRAHGHCNVVIRNVTLRGGVVLDLSGHASVLLHNVDIEGKKNGIELSGHASIRLRNSSVTAGKKAMRLSGHTSALVENSILKGKSLVTGYGTVVYDGKSRVGKLRKSGRYSKIRKR